MFIQTFIFRLPTRDTPPKSGFVLPLWQGSPKKGPLPQGFPKKGYIPPQNGPPRAFSFESGRPETGSLALLRHLHRICLSLGTLRNDALTLLSIMDKSPGRGLYVLKKNQVKSRLRGTTRRSPSTLEMSPPTARKPVIRL